MIRFCIISCWLLLACGANNNSDASHHADTVTSVTDTASYKLQQYAQFLHGLTKKEAASATKGAKHFKALFAGAAHNVSDSAFLLFASFYEALERHLNAAHQLDTADYTHLASDAISNRKPSTSEDIILANLHNNGFNLLLAEGSTYIQRDPRFLQHWFGMHVSPVVQQYLAQLQQEAKEGFASDAALQLMPRQLVNRLVWWERFAAAHPQFGNAVQADRRKKELLTVLLQGIDNTPVLLHGMQTVAPYFDTAFRYLQQNYPDSEAAMLTAPYAAALRNGNEEKARGLLQHYYSKGYISYVAL